MDIYQALTADHDALKPLLDQLVATAENDQRTKDLLDKIHAALIPHARAEEAVLYNSMREFEATKDLVGHSYREHVEAEATLQLLRGLASVNVDWTAAAKKLRDDLNHHIAEEETKIFGAARLVLLDNEAEQMATAFQRLKEESSERGDLKNTLALVANMMPARFAERFKAFNAPAS